MRKLILLLIICSTASANVCLSTASGNWNDSSKWTTCGGGIPGSGDTAKIAQGQTITIPAGYHAIVGLSAAGTAQAASINTTLSAAITTTGQTAITVASGTGIANGAYIILQKETTNTNEIVQVSAGGGTTSLTIVRSQLGTAASLHANGAAVYAGSIPAISCDGNTYYGANGTGILAVNGWLTYRGNVEQCTAVWTAGPDAVIEHDSSLAAAPSTTHYQWVIGSYLFPDAARLVIRGTAGHRTLIRNATGSGTFYGFAQYFGAAQGAGQFDFEYATINGCGNSASPCANATSHTGTTAMIARCDHCLVTNSSYMKGTVQGPSNTVSFTNSTFTGSTDTLWRVVTILPKDDGVATLDTIYTDGQIGIGGTANNNATGTHIRNVFIRSNVHTGSSNNNSIEMGGASFQVAEFDRVLRITDVDNSTGMYTYLPGGSITKLMGLVHSTSNPHCFAGPNGMTGATDTVDGGWFENIGGGTDGDTMGSAGAGKTIVRNGVWPCPLDTGIAMSILNMSTAATRTFEMWNNTYCGKDDGAGSARGFGFEVAGTAAVGMLAAAKDNLVFCAAPGCTGYLVHQGPTGTDSVGTYANVDYNWRWNITTGPYFQMSGTPYTSYSPNPPGAHDSTGDPQFVQQRHFLDWGQMLDGTVTSWTDIVAKFAKMNDDTGFDPRFTIQAAYDWLRAGYAPRNIAVATAGDTGGRVGAMDYKPPATVRHRVTQQ